MNGQKDGWDKAQAVASMLGAVAIPIVLLVVGHFFTEAASEREAKARSMELAIEILREPPQGEEIPGLREQGTARQGLLCPLRSGQSQ